MPFVNYGRKSYITMGPSFATKITVVYKTAWTELIVSLPTPELSQTCQFKIRALFYNLHILDTNAGKQLS